MKIKQPLSMTLFAGTLALLAQSTATAAELTLVEGYVKNPDGSVVKTGSGECLRTRFKDTVEYLAECGYSLVQKRAAAVETKPTSTAVTVAGTAVVAKDEKIVAAGDIEIEQVTIPNVEFALDSAELTSGYRAILDTASEILEPHRPVLRQGLAQLNVVGHTDSTGDAAYNKALSERRARTVANYLIQQDPSREAFIQVVGRGESEPVASNDTADGRQLNRRVTLEVIRK